MDIRWIGDFLDLAETRSFTRSADRRNVTQSALSRRIRSLEHWVGSPLFNRTTKPVELTPAGVRFRPVAFELFRKAMAVRDHSVLSKAGHGGAESRLPSGRDRPAVLVTPLARLSDREQSPHLSRSFAETVVHELTQSHFVDAVSETSLPESGEPHQKIAEDLGADFVLEGTYLTKNGRIRVSNNFVEVGTARSLFSRVNEVDIRHANDEFSTLATTVAWAVSRYVRTKTTGSATDKPTWGRTAFENFVVGIEILRSDFTEGHILAQPLFETAIELQLDYADAMAGLALCALRRWYADTTKQDRNLEDLLDWSNRALAADSENALAIMLKCLWNCYRGDFAQAELLTTRARQVSAHDPMLAFLYGAAGLYLGDYQGAESSFRSAMLVDTGGLDEVSVALGVTHYAAESYRDCIGALDSVTREHAGIAMSLKMASLAMLGDQAGVEHLRLHFRSRFRAARRLFPVRAFPFRDEQARERLVEGFRRAGILTDVGLEHLEH